MGPRFSRGSKGDTPTVGAGGGAWRARELPQKGHRKDTGHGLGPEQGAQEQRFCFLNNNTPLAESDTLFQWWLEHEAEIETVHVKDSLPRHAAFWERLTSDPEILQIVKTGYKPPFESEPQPFFKRNNITAQNNPDFVFDVFGSFV